MNLYNENVESHPAVVLLVEDDVGEARAVQRAFRKAKIANSIQRAVDGVEALEILRGENGHAKLESPYILLVDINMPRMNGLDFLKEVRADEALKHSIAFILTTSSAESDIASAYDLNVAGYIRKQLAGQDFSEMVKLLDTYWKVVELPHMGDTE